jgi:hypothetical protein
MAMKTVVLTITDDDYQVILRDCQAVGITEGVWFERMLLDSLRDARFREVITGEQRDGT